VQIFLHVFTKLISTVMYDSITKGSYVFKIASALYLGFARERVKGSFSIRNVTLRAACYPRVTGSVGLHKDSV
jgi:hypothetical protein